VKKKNINKWAWTDEIEKRGKEKNVAIGTGEEMVKKKDKMLFKKKTIKYSFSIPHEKITSHSSYLERSF